YAFLWQALGPSYEKSIAQGKRLTGDLEKFQPYKTYLEVSGGIKGWRGWTKSISTFFSVFMYYSVNLYSVIWAIKGISFLGSPLIAAPVLLVGIVGFWAIKKILQRRWQPKKGIEEFGKPVRPDKGLARPEGSVEKRRNLANVILWTSIFAVKWLWNYHVFSYLMKTTANIGLTDSLLLSSVITSPPVLAAVAAVLIIRALINYKRGDGLVKILVSTGKWVVGALLIGILPLLGFIAIPIGGLIAIGIMWATFVIFYFLDIFTLFYFAETAIGLYKGVSLGLTRIKKWKTVAKNFEKAESEFVDKLIPEELGLTPGQKEIACAKAWNLIIRIVHIEDLFTRDEMEHYSYGIEEGSNYLSGTVTRPPDLKKIPGNKKATERLVFYINSLFMDMEKVPVWDKIEKLSVMTPVGKESVIYPLDKVEGAEGYEDYLNQLYKNTGYTYLGYIIGRHRDEWQNLIARLESRMDLQGNENAIKRDIKDDIERMKRIVKTPSERLSLRNRQIIEEVEMWASCRFQPLARTVRGIMHYEEVFEFFAKMNYPDAKDEDIKKKVRDKFQYVVGVQLYGVFKDDDFKKISLSRLMKYYPDLEIAYFDGFGKEDGPYYSVLINSEGEKERIEVPAQLALIYGKPENQNHMIKFIRGSKLQVIDMNQDMYVEECFKMINLLEEFKKDPNIKLIGFPEDIFTEDFKTLGKYAAHADRTFVSTVQRSLNVLGMRMHYGHPDVFDMEYVRQMGGVSRTSYLNEDIYGAYSMLLMGGSIRFFEFIRGAKAREVGFGTISGLFKKFGGGAMEQTLTRDVERLVTSPMLGNPFIRFFKVMTLFAGAIGFFLCKPVVKK
ncbi:MAG: hypothetical protein KJ706_03210, partial [Candidatus Omnitrophica bacterium]|nr:hypothetical protein [Candidatus Omnitrophota bacterium]